jgi:hypothetical protein
MTALVLAAAVCSVVLCVTGVVLARRRLVLGVLLLVTGAIGLVAGDLVPRELATRELVTDCLTASIKPVASPLAWQAATGGVLVDARLDADVVTAMIADRLSQSPFDGADVRLGSDAVEVKGRIDSRLGPLDVTAELRPRVADQQLTWSFGSVLVGGRELPAPLVKRLLGAKGLNTAPQRQACGSGGLDRGTVRSATVGPSGLTLRVSL